MAEPGAVNQAVVSQSANLINLVNQFKQRLRLVLNGQFYLEMNDNLSARSNNPGANWLRFMSGNVVSRNEAMNIVHELANIVSWIIATSRGYGFLSSRFVIGGAAGGVAHAHSFNDLVTGQELRTLITDALNAHPQAARQMRPAASPTGIDYEDFADRLHGAFVAGRNINIVYEFTFTGVVPQRISPRVLNTWPML
jgi:hypothetical protein